MYCLDSTIVIDYLKGDKLIKSKLDKTLSRIFITNITLCELFKGAYLSSDIERNLALVNSLFDYFYILELDNNAARIYGKNILN